MRKKFLLMLGILFLLTGCAQAPQISPTPEPTQIPTQPPPPTPTPTQPPTDTPLPPTDTPEPTATLSPFLFQDEFNGALAEGWEWLSEDPTHWNLTDVADALRIILQPSNINNGEPKNFLVREAPTGNFEIATFVHFTPATNYQFAGLLIYQSQGNAMQFGRAFAQCGSTQFCIGNAIYFDVIEGGKNATYNCVTKVQNESQAYLRLRRVGTTYTGYFSEDGASWSEICSHESNITPQYVGVVGDQAYESETTADFDYFTIQTLP